MPIAKSFSEELIFKSQLYELGRPEAGLDWDVFVGRGLERRQVPWNNVTSRALESFVEDVANQEPFTVEAADEFEAHTHPITDLEIGAGEERNVIQIEDGTPTWQYLKLHE